MSAFDLVELLFKKGLIADKVRAKLVKQIEGADKTVSPKSIARALVRKGLLDSEQAKSALTELEEGTSDTRDDLALVVDPEPEPVEVVAPADEEMGLADDDDELVEPIPESAPVAEVEPITSTVAVVDGLDDAIGDEIDDHDADELTTATSGKKKKRRKYSANRWDSPLMLAGGGGLILMIALGGVLWFLMTRETSQAAYDSAEESYRSAAYIQAATKYSNFIQKFSNDENTSAAKVKLKLSNIWNDVSNKNWEAALGKVQSELPEIEAEVAFDTARGELASILPQIMQGFAETASDAESSEEAQRNLDLAKSTLEEVNNSSYLPTRFRKDLQPKIDAIEGIMKTVERDINRDKELATAVGEINAAVEQGETGKAYEIRRQLLNKYPLLNDNASLNATIASITDKERARVQPLSNAPSPIGEDRPSGSDIRVTLAARKGKSIDAIKGQLAYVRTRGSIYALNAADGTVAWRRFVGFESGVDPLPLGQNAGSDVIAVDSRNSELIRLAAANGKAAWRLPCEGRLTTPVRFDEKLFVACSNDEIGKLLAIDPASGQPTSGADFPMPVSCSPLVTSDGRIIQPGDHSSLFVLNSQDMDCTDVAYIGHGAGTIVVPPIELLGHLVVAENPAPNFSLLHVLAPNADDGGKLREVIKPIRLTGRVVVPMTTDGKRLVVSTDLGAVEVFELDPRRVESPLEKAVTGISSMNNAAATGYSHFSGGKLWVGDRQLARYDVQVASGSLARKWIRNKGDRYIAPFQQFGNVLIAVRQPNGRRGATVTALQIANNNSDGQELWEIDLGVPPAGNVFVNGKALNVVTANTDLFQIGREELKQPVLNAATARIPSARLPVLSDAVELGNGVRAFVSASSPGQVVVFDPSAQSPLKMIELDLGGDEPSTTPVAFKGGLIVPSASGAVYIIDPKTGKPAAHEFQPSLTSGQRVNWPRPVVIGDEIILPDGAGKVYRVGLQSKPQPHLAALAETATDFRPVGSMAAAGTSVYGIRSGISGDDVVALNAADLSMSPESWSLGGRVAWGPETVGDVVMVASDSGELLCLDGGQSQLWRIKLEHGAVAGDPLIVGEQFILTSIRGTVWSIDGKTGNAISTFDVGEPLGSGAMQFGGRSIALGSDGTLHVFRMQ